MNGPLDIPARVIESTKHLCSSSSTTSPLNHTALSDKCIMLANDNDGYKSTPKSSPMHVNSIHANC